MILLKLDSAGCCKLLKQFASNLWVKNLDNHLPSSRSTTCNKSFIHQAGLSDVNAVEGDRGAETRGKGARGGWEAGGDGTGCGSHVKAGEE